jgi:hypothetical protein
MPSLPFHLARNSRIASSTVLAGVLRPWPGALELKAYASGLPDEVCVSQVAEVVVPLLSYVAFKFQPLAYLTY